MFRYLEDTAYADIAFEAEGRSIEDAFVSAAQALTDTMADPSALAPSRKHTLSLTAASLELLLFDWLAELIYLKDAEQLLFSSFEVAIKKQRSRFSLRAIIHGTPLVDVAKESLRNDVKAVTMHQLSFQETEQGYRCRVVLDI
ncbi:archease [Candidatus Woesearchaeota archaeon]|nr:archease [Candidatus Woesearchaeota archaeon]